MFLLNHEQQQSFKQEQYKTLKVKEKRSHGSECYKT